MDGASVCCVPPPVSETTLRHALQVLHSTRTQGLWCPPAGEWTAPVQRVPADGLSYDRFLRDFMLPGRPVLVTHATRRWAASTQWAKDGEGVCWDGVEAWAMGCGVVPVQRCWAEGQPCTTMPIRQYREWWEGRAQAQQQQGMDKELLYLKDWHLAKHVRANPQQPPQMFYTIPEFLAQDWLNLHWDRRSGVVPPPCAAPLPAVALRGVCEGCGSAFGLVEALGRVSPAPQSQPAPQVEGVNDDYRFVYVGPKGSRTHLHADVFRSFSWSANVVGTKHWRLYHPSHAHVLGEAGARGESVEGPKGEDLVQEADELLFVPSDSFHVVDNASDCLSINHNWVNACNIHRVVHFLLLEYASVVDSLRGLVDDADLLPLSHDLMRAHSGMNLPELWAFLREMAQDQRNVLLAAVTVQDALGSEGVRSCAVCKSGAREPSQQQQDERGDQQPEHRRHEQRQQHEAAMLGHKRSAFLNLCFVVDAMRALHARTHPQGVEVVDLAFVGECTEALFAHAPPGVELGMLRLLFPSNERPPTPPQVE